MVLLLVIGDWLCCCWRLIVLLLAIDGSAAAGD